MSETLIGVLIGGLLTATPTVITVLVGKVSEERRHFRDKVFTAAIEEWRIQNERIRADHPGYPLVGLDSYLIHAAHLMRRLDSTKDITESESRKIIRSSLEIAYAAQQEAQKFALDKASGK